MHATSQPDQRKLVRVLAVHALRAALIAAPFALSAAPAKAASLFVTYDGFTGVFAPTEWGRSSAGTPGSGTLNATTMTLVAPANMPAGNPVPASFQFTFDSDKLIAETPPPPPGTTQFYEFRGGTYSFDWSWTFEEPGPGVIFPFQTFVESFNPGTLWTYNGGAFDSLANYTTSGTIVGQSLEAGDLFGFRLSSTTANPFFTTATGTITNFTFTAEYALVPGPLPIAGAGAAFAWSRKLRRRLKTVGATA